MDQNQNEPEASRPYIPGYGIPETREGMLPWSYVQERLREAQNYWISTSNAKGKPHATPVWAVWRDDVLYFDGGPDTRRGRDMAVNPFIAVHLEDGSRVVILEGMVRELTRPPLDLREYLAKEYARKYSGMGYEPTPETWENGGLYAFRPNLVLAWTEFPKDTTRWQFEEEG